ncbi:MAG: hypothetical protein AB1744_12455, partial [Candidatus Zixiibacteriota bacterium]
KYYVSVRVLFPDRSLSKPSNEVVAVCGPRGEMELSIRYKSDRDGFSFEKNDYVGADALDNDLYFYAKDGIDYLVSPSHLGGFLKENRLQVLPFTGELHEVTSQFRAFKQQPTQDRVVVQVGDWVHLLTPDNTHTLLHVLGLDGDGETRSVRLFYASSPLAGEAIF